MVNGAPIKGNRAYPTGRITFRELKEELPFPMKMVTVPLPGHVIQVSSSSISSVLVRGGIQGRGRGVGGVEVEDQSWSSAD